MGTFDGRTLRLRILMRRHQLTPAEVGRLLHRNATYVRSWHAGINIIPDAMLRLLELEIRVGERIERVQIAQPAG
jgi:hypothetical protein